MMSILILYCHILLWESKIFKAFMVSSKKKESSPAIRHGGAWGERRYSSYSFTTSALDGGAWCLVGLLL